MKKYRVTILVPHTRTIEAENIQAAALEAGRLTKINDTDERAPKAKLHSVIEETPGHVLDFGPSPAA